MTQDKSHSPVTVKAGRASASHTNRHPFNRLLYDIGDAALFDVRHLLKGDIYDLGCGEMPYREWILHFSDSYIGVDWACSIHTLKADVIADLNKPLPFDDKVADTVFSFSVLEHLCEPQVMLGEAFRILRPGGYIILQVPFMWWLHEAPHDYYRYTYYGLKYMFEKAGFHDIEVIPLTGFWTMWFLKFNYQSKRLVRGPRLIRWAVTSVLHVVWWMDQRIAQLLDRYWPADGETAGYLVTARKP